MKIARLIFIKLLIILILVAELSVVFALEEKQPNQKVVMLIVNRVDLQNLLEMNEVQRLMEEGSIGLMNIRASGRYSEYKSYATIGWGTRAEANKESQAFFNVDKNSTAIYRRRLGEIPSDKGIVNLSINRLIQQNYKGEFGAVPGSLGEILRQNGLKTVVLGNADTEDEKRRAAALIAMDKQGYIDYGDISSKLIMENFSKPFGIQTNYDLLFEEFTELYPQGDFFVIETGDLSRLESYKNNLNRTAYQNHRKAILQEINQFTEKVTNHIEGDPTLLMLVVPYPTVVVFESGARLTPIIFYGEGITGGLLTSDTTRREGIIGNIDIAPTVLAYFGLSPEEMTGRRINELSTKNNIQFLEQLYKNVVNISQQRYKVLYTFAVFEMLASVFALLAIIFKKRIPSLWRRGISNVLIATIVAPFTFLLMPIFDFQTPTLIYTLLMLITSIVVVSLSLLIRKDWVKMLILSTGLVVLGLLVDLITGQQLIKSSILGYDPIIGARYYGIGNEFAGVLIGSTLVFTTAIVEKNKKLKWLVPIIYLVIVVAIGFPQWGANVGGTITAMFAFLFTTFKLLGVKMNFKKWLSICGMVVIAVSIFAVVDMFVLETKSHLAGAIQQIYRGGPLVVLQIITRKIAMNIRIMGVTIWSRVLLIAIVVIGILFYKPVGVLKKIASAYPHLAAGWTGILVACGVGFVFNDSGVVTAALAAIFLSTSILYLVLNDLDDKLIKE